MSFKTNQKCWRLSQSSLWDCHWSPFLFQLERDTMPRSSTTIPESNVKGIPEAEKSIDDLRQEALDGVLQIAQFGCLAFGDFSDAGAIGVFGPPMVIETVKLAKDNAKVAAKVDLLIEVGPYAGLATAVITFLAQVLVNRGIFKPEHFANAGIMDPKMLEVEIKTQLLKKAADAQRAQMEAQAEMQRLHDEMANAQNGDNPERESVPNE